MYIGTRGILGRDVPGAIWEGEGEGEGDVGVLTVVGRAPMHIGPRPTAAKPPVDKLRPSKRCRSKIRRGGLVPVACFIAGFATRSTACDALAFGGGAYTFRHGGSSTRGAPITKPEFSENGRMRGSATHADG